MGDKVILIRGEHPDEAPNPSKCEAFRIQYPTLFAPLQTETFARIQAGHNLALIAPTSSGKTLAVAAPLFEARQKTVFVYPFRALVLDQSNQLLRYGEPFGLNKNHFAQIMGGLENLERELARAVEKNYILMTPDKLISLFMGDRTSNKAALTILSNYAFVFDEIHAYNSLMRTSLIYFIRSVKYWREAIGGKLPAFYFLSATFPEDLWPILQQELGMGNEDRIEGVSNTGDVTLLLRPGKGDAFQVAQEIKELGMATNVVGIFNTAIKAWRVAEEIWGRELAKQRLFVGQDKMSEFQRLSNFQRFIANPANGGICGSPAIEAGVDFSAAHLVFEETYTDSFLQRFGRAARSGQPATVLCYSSTLYALQQAGQMKSEYERKECLDFIGHVMPRREPRQLLTGLAAYLYYKFWGGPNFIEEEISEICHSLEGRGVDFLLTFRGFIPYAHYQSGESISYRTLFKKDLRMEQEQVVGSPGLERYFFAGERTPVVATLKKIGYVEKLDDWTTVMLVKVSFSGFGKHWVVLEYKSPQYEHNHPNEEDDNICLRGFPEGEIGRVSGKRVRNGILRFYDVDA